MAGGQFDIQYNQQAPAVVNMPRASMNVDTGADMLGQAFAHLGESAFGVAMGMKKTQQALDLSNMKRKLDETNNDELSELENAFDDESQRKISEKYDKARSSIQSDDAEVSNQFTLHANEVMPHFNRGKSQRIVANKQKELTANFEANSADMLGNGDVVGYENLVKSMDFLPPATKDALVKDAPANSYLQQAENLINRGDAKSIENANAILTALGGEKIKLTAQQLDKRDSLTTQMYSAQNRSNSALKVQQDKEQWDLYKKSEDGTLTQAMLDASVISADEKRQIWENYTLAQYQKAKTGISMIEEGDPVFRAAVDAAIDLTPEKVTVAGLYANADKIGTKNVTSRVDRLNKNLEDKNPIAKKFKAQLASVYEAKMFGEKINPATSDTYMELQGELDTFLATNPSYEQAQKRFSEIIRKKVKTGWISSIFSPDITQTQAITQSLMFGPGVTTGSVIFNKLFGKENETNTPPKEYPDATWDVQNNMWVVTRNGRKMGVQ